MFGSVQRGNVIPSTVSWGSFPKNRWYKSGFCELLPLLVVLELSSNPALSTAVGVYLQGEKDVGCLGMRICRYLSASNDRVDLPVWV